MTDRAIITVVNAMSQTSMEYHEFVLYRATRFADEQHHLVVLGPSDAAFMADAKANGAADGINIVDCGGRYRDLRRRLDRIIRRCRREGRPVLVHAHMGRSGAVALLSRVRPVAGAPALYTMHTMFNRCPWRNRLMPIINYLLANEVVFVSQSAFDAFPAALRRARWKHAHVIVNGVNIEWVDDVLNRCGENGPLGDSRGSRRGDDTLRLLNVGRLIPAKNQAWLIRAMADWPRHVHLTIIGGGPLEGELAALVRELEVGDRVRLAGLIPRADVFREMRAADLFVSSSVREGLPIAVLEAMAARMPVVLSDIGPHREIGRHHADLPVLPLDVERWAGLLRSMEASSVTRRQSLGEQNRVVVERAFSLARMHDEYTRLYEGLWRRSMMTTPKLASREGGR